MECPTRKPRYPDELTAKMAAIRYGKRKHTRNQGDPGVPRKCGICDGWHLWFGDTSASVRGSQGVR